MVKQPSLADPVPNASALNPEKVTSLCFPKIEMSEFRKLGEKIKFMNHKPISRKSNIVVQELKNEVLIYDLTINKAFCLNPTSTLIWQLCDGKLSIAEMSRVLSQKLHTPITEDLIWLALDQFKQDNLLEQSQPLKIEFGGLSRREIIRKVGYASLVMLPTIVGVTAPRAIQAASGLCQIDADCNDNNLCTLDRCDTQTGQCVHPPKVCNDNNPCTRDSCDPRTGCVFTFDSTIGGC